MSDTTASAARPRIPVAIAIVVLIVVELLVYDELSPHTTANLRRADYRLIELLSPLPLLLFLLLDRPTDGFRERVRYALAGQVFFLSCLVFTLLTFVPNGPAIQPTIFLIVRLFLGAGAVIGFGLFFLGTRLSRASRDLRVILAAVFGATSMATMGGLSELCWQRLGGATTWCAARLLELLGLEIQLTATLAGYSIRANGFSADIQPMCSGLEGIFLFLYVMSLMVIRSEAIRTSGLLIEYYLIGVLLMFGLNVVRITSIIYFNQSGPAVAYREMFHSIGAPLLYCLAILLYLKGIQALLARKATRAEEQSATPTAEIL